MKKWSVSEDSYLTLHWPFSRAIDISVVLGRSVIAVRTRAFNLGLKTTVFVRSPSKDAWSEEELQYLYDHWKDDSQHAVAAALGRSLNAVKHKASRLRIRSYDRWSEVSDSELRYLDSLRIPRAEIATRMDVPYWAVVQRVAQLGLNGRSHLDLAWRGSDHPSWRGGARDPFYQSAEWDLIRVQIMERDGYTCQDCKTFIPSGVGLHVHHKIPRRFTEDDSPENLVILCHSCHMNRPEHYWVEVPPSVLAGVHSG